jgi:hypothetical protein
MLLVFGMCAPGNAVFFVVVIYTLSYASIQLGMPRESLLVALLGASCIYLVAIPCFGWLADRWGYWRVIAFGSISSIAFGVVYFRLVDSGSPGIIFLAMSLMLAIAHAPLQAPQAAQFSSLFAVSRRYTGISLSQALPTTIVGGTAPFLATLFVEKTGSTTSIAVYIAVLGLVGLACAWMAGHRRLQD